jgi:hypothetical protein
MMTSFFTSTAVFKPPQSAPKISGSQPGMSGEKPEPQRIGNRADENFSGECFGAQPHIRRPARWAFRLRLM